MSQNFIDQGYYRRKFPRRVLDRRVGVLARGQYFICMAGELGEGGMSFETEMVIAVNVEVVVTLQIPGGDFVCLRGEVRSRQKKGNRGQHLMYYGIAFTQIQFTNKRQIRTFVSARTLSASELLSS